MIEDQAAVVKLKKRRVGKCATKLNMNSETVVISDRKPEESNFNPENPESELSTLNSHNSKFSYATIWSSKTNNKL